MTMKPIWKEIKFDDWRRGKHLSVSVNEYGSGPVVLQLDGDGYETYDLSEWMTPDEARELAAKLIEAANAADQSGRH